MNKFHIGNQTDTHVVVNWTSGSCPTQDEVREMLQTAKMEHLKPVLEFDPKVVGFPFGKTIFPVKYTREDKMLSAEIWDMGVTAVYEWFLFDRYRHQHICSLTPSYECHLLYTTYDVNAKYHNQTPGYIKAFPREAKQEEAEWETLREKIEEWLAAAWTDTDTVQYFNINVKNREEFWPESVEYEPEMTTEEREKYYNEFMKEQLEYERCNPSKG